jgi:NAD(P)-dependent dehydrogenase (short-subunit alcohol dehydrogenase family)
VCSGHIDYLINNAGFVQGGAVEENSQEEVLAQFNTNFFAVINITNLFLPHFRQRKQGTIVNISSQGAVMFPHGFGIYCASKAAVDAISETWAQELADFNIRCVSIQVGLARVSRWTSLTFMSFSLGWALSHRRGRI